MPGGESFQTYHESSDGVIICPLEENQPCKRKALMGKEFASSQSYYSQLVKHRFTRPVVGISLRGN